MRQRVTYITKSAEGLSPDELNIADGTLSGPLISAVREDRLTFALDELLLDLRKILSESREVHIKWSSPTASETVSPLLSRLPPGLHLFYTPRDASAAESLVSTLLRSGDLFTNNGNSRQSLCLALRSLFGHLSCHTPKVRSRISRSCWEMTCVNLTSTPLLRLNKVVSLMRRPLSTSSSWTAWHISPNISRTPCVYPVTMRVSLSCGGLTMQHRWTSPMIPSHMP